MLTAWKERKERDMRRNERRARILLERSMRETNDLYVYAVALAESQWPLDWTAAKDAMLAETVGLH